MEGGLKAPIRHPHGYDEPDYLNEDQLDAELRRVFDICHGCRRCFNLCDSFPRLFELIDSSESGELDTVSSKGFGHVIDGCTLCDMCFMVSCPYVPPHEFNIDFPHLVLRYRAIRFSKGFVSWGDRQLTKTDRNGKIGSMLSWLANWSSRTSNRTMRTALELLVGVDRNAALPKYHRRTLVKHDELETQKPKPSSSDTGRKVALYATCFANYNNPNIGIAAINVLQRNGVVCKVVYSECCGMPQLEQGGVGVVADKARTISKELAPWIDNGYQIVPLVPSCTLMFKFEWPLLLPGDVNVQSLSRHTSDISEYIVGLSKAGELVDGLSPLPGTVTAHLACHARAQNIGPQAVEMLRLIPNVQLAVIERCSGHGGAWGVKKGNFETALKIGKPAVRQALKLGSTFVVSECPLAGEHIRQGMEGVAGESHIVKHVNHPIELLAQSYGFGKG